MNHLFGEPARYLNPFTDFGFKRLFGTEANKDLLIEFLNVFLELPSPISSLTYRATEQLGDLIDDRKAVFDIYCTSKSGESFIVEMQKAKQDYFIDRSIFYSSFLIREQALKGNKWNYKLEPVYVLAVLDFVFNRGVIKKENSETEYKHFVQMKDRHNNVFYNKLTFAYLEMPHFNKSESELVTDEDKWIYILKNLSSFKDRPAKLTNRIFKKFFEVAEISNFTPNELLTYETNLKVYRDNTNASDTEKREARQEGRQEGKEEERRALIQNLHSMNMQIEFICKATQLTPEEVQQYLSK